ncbi:hypothetical protein [Runella slithyformis]|uniref:Lipocalin-like domain-containing protein n=1 Tax=Runella slithyformis (strain ATCC 29530 / DSM 19594 / LMG 11500 / NCIMB 11436 / LSU 4) TaxID=761193 RepID=A0A7U4E7S1_RUNSL|nr:hypothetical protein [Runella slithyformis]AEI50951.1 hypothetical protein Runsl_4631 [Runella slithyformis DSM 19594]
MKKSAFILSLLFAFFLMGCNRNSPGEPTDETSARVLTTNPWKVDKITDLNGNVINPSALPESSKALFGINIQFSDDKTVRAIDPVARTVINGGTWNFLDNQKVLDIDIKDLKGQFPINTLERSRMVLLNKVIFNGLNFEVYLVLVPAL